MFYIINNGDKPYQTMPDLMFNGEEYGVAGRRGTALLGIVNIQLQTVVYIDGLEHGDYERIMSMQGKSAEEQQALFADIFVRELIVALNIDPLKVVKGIAGVVRLAEHEDSAIANYSIVEQLMEARSKSKHRNLCLRDRIKKMGVLLD